MLFRDNLNNVLLSTISVSVTKTYEVVVLSNYRKKVAKTKKKIRKVKSKINHGQKMKDTPSSLAMENTETVELAMQTAAAKKSGTKVL